MDEQGGGDRKRRAGLLQRLGDELVSGGAKAVEYMEAAALLFEELGDSKTACDVHSRLGLYLSSINIAVMDMRRAMPHYKKAEVFLAEQPESARHAAFYLRLAAACTTTSRVSDGLAAGKRAMEISERLDQPVLREVYWSNAAVITSFLLISSGSVTEGLQLAHQARRRADPIDDPVTGSAVAGAGGDNYCRLRDPLEAQDWYTQELAKPRTARSANRRAILHQNFSIACRDMGELAKARAYLAEAHAENEGLPLSVDQAMLLFFEGQWELADQMLTARAEHARTSGNRNDEFWVAYGLAGLHRFSGDLARAVQVLQTARDISVDGGDILQELFAQSWLATNLADAGDALQALPHLQRCRQIVAAGENWFGIAGLVERAEAVVAAAQGEYVAAEAHFEKAIATFHHYCLPWEQADTLQYWGRALLAAGDHARAIEKFDDAIEIYRSRGAGARFVEYVMADRMRAQDSKSTDAEVQPPPTDSDPTKAPALTTRLQTSTSNNRVRGEVSPPQTRAINTMFGTDAPAGVTGQSQRVVATLLFIDIVSSTEHVTRLRDRGWVELRRSFLELIRKQLARLNGREIDTAGDGMLAIFDHPAAAIHCAFAMSQGVEKLGLQMRAGIHTGECELVGGDVVGIAVHIGARVAAQAGPNEVMVSSTVRDLLVGGEITFVDRGVSALKGIPGEWRLYAVEQQG
jgi:class 3 adenylate cyclase/tetratricopeptide (TPR) repeat protein